MTIDFAAGHRALGADVMDTKDGAQPLVFFLPANDPQTPTPGPVDVGQECELGSGETMTQDIGIRTPGPIDDGLELDPDRAPVDDGM